MDISKMKNMIVLKNIPSNIVDEAIVVLKENKLAKKYQYVESEKKTPIASNKEKESKENYIVKEAENVICQYIKNLEMKSPKWKNSMKELERKYKRAIHLNFLLALIALLGIVINLV